MGFDPRLPGPPLNHAEGVGLHHAVRRAGRAARSAEQRPVLIARDTRRLDVLIEEHFELVVTGGLVFLAALLVEPDPSAPPLGEIIPHVHLQHGADAGKAINHRPDQGAVAQADERPGINNGKQRPRLVPIEDRRAAFG